MKDIGMELLTHGKNVRSCSHPQRQVHQSYRWLSGLTYQGYALSWVECVEERQGKINRFVYLTDIEARFDNAIELALSGRMRFKIENEGFNAQKNGGYNLAHKYSRVSAQAMKNYISLMQIAHLINQLYELSPVARPLLVGKETLKNMWKNLIGSLTHVVLEAAEVLATCAVRMQIRYS